MNQSGKKEFHFISFSNLVSSEVDSSLESFFSSGSIILMIASLNNAE